MEDIDHIWANSMREGLNALRHMQMSANDFTICQVQVDVRLGKEMYYEPVLVSIGPYHRGRKHLQPMEAHKLQHLNDFLERNTENSLEIYINSLREVEGRARRCYFDHINLESKEFVKMLLLDGCFVIEFALKYHQTRRDENEIRSVSWLLGRIMHDLVLLENQIPFFVISILFELLLRGVQVGEDEGSMYSLGIIQILTRVFFPSLEYNGNSDSINHLLSLVYYNLVWQQREDSNVKSTSSFKLGVLSNLLKALRLASLSIYCTLSSKQTSPVDYHKTTTVPCASKLVECGIKFKRRSGDYSMIEIAYKDGVLEIPPKLQIGEEHKSLLFNLLAFEQCNFSIQTTLNKLKLSSYFQFMNFLIDSPKDVEILQECGIIVSFLKSSEDTALFFNQLNDHTYIKRDDHYLLPVYKDINKFCDSKWHRYRAKLRRDYFSNPWAILSLIAAVILLILTLMQTFFAWYGYFKPPI